MSIRLGGILCEISEVFDLKGRFFSENRSFFRVVSWEIFDFSRTFAQIFAVFGAFFAVFGAFFAVFGAFFAVFLHFFALFKDILTENGIFRGLVLQKLT